MSLVEGLLLCVLLVGAGTEVSTTELCRCQDDSEIGTWCEVHAVGHLGSVAIESKELFDVLDAHGHEVIPETFDCPVCREAIETAGYCAEHRIGFVGGRAYFSRLTYTLASGERPRPEEQECTICRSNAESIGWCATHRVGRVGSVAIRDREAFDAARRAIEIVAAADELAKRCPHCAAAMVTDTRCPVCRLLYHDGRVVENRPVEGGSPPPN